MGARQNSLHSLSLSTDVIQAAQQESDNSALVGRAQLSSVNENSAQDQHFKPFYLEKAMRGGNMLFPLHLHACKHAATREKPHYESESCPAGHAAELLQSAFPRQATCVSRHEL